MSRFGVRPRGMWLAERVWEPHLAKPIAEAGVEYVILDDNHFKAAGLPDRALTGYFLLPPMPLAWLWSTDWSPAGSPCPLDSAWS